MPKKAAARQQCFCGCHGCGITENIQCTICGCTHRKGRRGAPMQQIVTRLQ